MNRALTLKWFAVLGLASLFYLLAPRDVSPQMPLYLGMTSAAVIIWTFDLLPAVAVAAALTFLYLLTNMAPPEVVLGRGPPCSSGPPSARPSSVKPWKRPARQARGPALYAPHGRHVHRDAHRVRHRRHHPRPAAGLRVRRTVIFCAIAVGIIRALDIDPKSRLSSIIVIACFFAAAAPTCSSCTPRSPSSGRFRCS